MEIFSRQHRQRAGGGIAVLVGALALGACQEEIRSAQWYMGHGTELQAKLTECKKYPSLNDSDQNCKNAGEAWATLVSATQQPATPAAPEPAPAPEPQQNR